MSNSKKTGQNDRELFRQAMSGVRPLRYDKIKPFKSHPKAVRRPSEFHGHLTFADMMSDQYCPNDQQTGETLHFTRSGIQYSIIRKLKRGQYKIEAELDLHGQNIDTARQAVHAFLSFCQTENYRCVSLIHGKGLRSRNKDPVLKKMINRWLQQRKEVLAFTSAQPRHGGTGAIYLLLKRQHKLRNP